MTKGEALYFTHADSRVAEAIVGHDLELRPATLFGFTLAVQHSLWMPESVQNILAANRSTEEMRRFGAFVARPLKGAAMTGYVTPVDAQDIALFDNYELEGLWTERLDGQVVFVAGDPQPKEASVHILGNKGGRAVDPARYFGGVQRIPSQLNSLERMTEIATIAREAFLAEKQ